MSDLRHLADRIGHRPLWMDSALCAQVDTGDVFYPEGKGSSAAEAKRICGMCPLATRMACLEYAIVNNETEGVWGMTSPRERRKLARAEKAA